MNLSISADVKRAAYRLATKRGISVSALVAELIRTALSVDQAPAQ